MIIPLPWGFIPLPGARQTDGVALAASIANAVQMSTASMGKAPTTDNSPALDPTYSTTMEELVVGRGYPLESHEVVTEDGYFLTLHRIPYGRGSNSTTGKGAPKPVVFLQHGITLASNCFTVLDADQSLGFILADAGYDVWMGNNRGTTYSRGHMQYKNNALKASNYWYISMDKLAKYDMPAMINYALKISSAKQLALIGHSQGCTLVFMMLASLDSMNDKVSGVIHLGPVVFPKWINAPLVVQIAAAYTDQIPKAIALGELLPNYATAPLYYKFCNGKTVSDPVCNTVIFRKFYAPAQLASGVDDNMLISTTWPAGIASRLLEHWAQLIRQADPHRLSMYDYGSDCSPKGKPFYESCNQKEYFGATTPPAYDLGRIRTPQAWITGGLDVMATLEDVTIQLSQVPKTYQVQKEPVLIKSYGHMDFVWDRAALHAGPVLKLLQRYSQQVRNPK